MTHWAKLRHMNGFPASNLGKCWLMILNFLVEVTSITAENVEEVQKAITRTLNVPFINVCSIVGLLYNA